MMKIFITGGAGFIGSHLAEHFQNSGDEVTISTSLDNFKQRFPLSKYEYTGEIEFNYDTWGFTRYMVIGIK